MDWIPWMDSAADPVAWQALGGGIVLGLGAAMPIGPVNVELSRRVLRSGVAAGVALGFGAVTVDVVYAVLSTLSFARLLDRPAVIVPVAVVGVGFLAYLGVQCLQAAQAAWRVDPIAIGHPDPTPPTAPTASPRPARSAYLAGLLMTLLNPMTLAFWLTVVPAAGGAAAGVPAGGGDAGIAKGAAGHLPMMGAGVFIGTTAWVVGFASVLAWVSARAGAREPSRRGKWLAAADGVGGLTLLAFAAAAALRLLRSLA